MEASSLSTKLRAAGATLQKGSDITYSLVRSQVSNSSTVQRIRERTHEVKYLLGTAKDQLGHRLFSSNLRSDGAEEQARRNQWRQHIRQRYQDQRNSQKIAADTGMLFGLVSAGQPIPLKQETQLELERCQGAAEERERMDALTQEVKQSVASFDESVYRSTLALDDMCADLTSLDAQVRLQLSTLAQFEESVQQQRQSREPAEAAWRDSVTSAVREAHKEFETEFVLKKSQEHWAAEAELDLELSAFGVKP